VSDRIGDAPLMRLGTIHHSIALFPFHRAGIQHINHQVGSTDDIQRSFHFVRENQVNITFGPGAHPTSSAEFLYFTGPEGMTFEYSTGVREIHDEPAWRDRQFHFEPKGFCHWGSAPQIAAFKK
jgi:2,3-dihydroxy-p-cumate/2,3-dihydroxybenzoate 3,4-dioxygenase